MSKFERIDRRINALLGNGARQDGCRVEMREGGGGRRIRQIVGRHIDRLHRGDRALVRRGDPLLQGAHVGGKRRLIADRGRNAAEQRRNFRTRLGETENIVDEEQHVLALVAEILGDREAGQSDAGARPRRFVHLAIHKSAFRTLGGAAMLMRIDIHLGLDHFMIEIVAFAGPLADPGEHRIAAMRLGDIVDELHDQNGLADPGAAEQADLAALGVRREKIDDLDAGHQDLRLGRLFGIGRRRLMDRAPRGRSDRTQFVHRLADDIDDAAKTLLADGNRDRALGVGDLLAADEAFGNVHRDAAHRIFAEMLRHFEDQAVAMVVGFEGVEDLRQMAVEFHVDDGADDLRDVARGQVGCGVSHASSP